MRCLSRIDAIADHRSDGLDTCARINDSATDAMARGAHATNAPNVPERRNGARDIGDDIIGWNSAGSAHGRAARSPER